jgi:hypothetical protein
MKMSNEKCDVYVCGFCGWEGKWDLRDEIHGDLWGCEMCGRVFCSKCFVDRLGTDAYWNMMQSGGYILCPDCEEKLRAEEALYRRTERGK